MLSAGGPLQWSRITSHHTKFDLKPWGASSQKRFPIILRIAPKAMIRYWSFKIHCCGLLRAKYSGQSLFVVAKCQRYLLEGWIHTALIKSHS